MLLAALSIFGAFAFLAVVEYVSRTRRKIHSEITRKFVHMAAGCFVATWPFYFKWWEIGLLSLAALFVVSISIQYNILKSIHSVNRRSLGEVFFAIAIGLLAFLDGSHWIFAAAMLHLGLADGLAAIVGVKYGKRSRYEVFGYRKSRAGTLTFLAASVVITGAYFGVTHTHDWTLFAVVPLLTTMTENIAVAGTDNLLVPLMVAGLLKFF
jgi:phytol kinase